MLLLDTSGSMAGIPLESERAAAIEFLSHLPAEVRVGAIAYGSTPTLLSPPTTDRAAVATQIAGLTAGTDTALYDAVIFAGGQFTPEAERRAIVLLTDGEDNVSSASLDAASTAAGHVPVHVIELVTERSDRPALDRLASAGGGSVAGASDPAALTDLYRRAAGAVANQYRITYPSNGAGAAELTVRVNTPEGTLSDATTVELPAAAPVTTTAAPTTVPATAPATTAPATREPSEPIAKLDTTRAEPSETSKTGLLIGGLAFFVAILVVVALPLTGDRRRRNILAGLGLHRVSGNGVTQLKENMSARADRFLERRGRSRSMAASLEAAGISLRPGEFVVLVLAASAIGGLGALALFGPLGLLATIVIAPLFARAVLDRRATRRRAKFAEQLPDNLQLLTSGLKAGYGLLPALDNVAQEAPEPSRSEFRRVLLEIRVGRDQSDALNALAARMASTDFEWVIGAIDINREVGGDLAATLDNVGETIRERQRLGRHVNALTAEGRLSAYVLTGLPVFLAFAMSAMNPGYLQPLLSGVGLVAVAVGAGMLLCGWLWMKRLIRVDF
jgi:tight adherence protein B